MVLYRDKSAVISDCFEYRYVLERVWGTNTSRLLVIGLNPSTADSMVDDPTIRRCVGFAQSFGYDGLLVGNLFAARSASPTRLKQIADPVGPDNDWWLDKLQSRANRVVAAWGNGGRLNGRSSDVFCSLKNPYCFGRTKLGEPRHPLYLRGSTVLVAL